MIAHVQSPTGEARPVFTLTPTIPVDKALLREILTTAMTRPDAVPSWGTNIVELPGMGPTYTFDEKEWLDDPASGMRPPAHRVDLYTIHRGLMKVFDTQHDVTISTRQMLVRALFTQPQVPSIMRSLPEICDRVLQLGLFDQQVY